MSFQWHPNKTALFAILGLALLGCAYVSTERPQAGRARGNPSVIELRKEIEETEKKLSELPQRLIRETGGTLGHRTLRDELGTRTAWLEVDLGEVASFDLIALIPMVNIDENQKITDFGFPLHYQITVYDDPNDTTGRLLFDSKGKPEFNHPNQSPVLIECPSASARRIRLTALETPLTPITQDHVFALAELLVFHGNENLAIGKPVSANLATHFRPIYEPHFATDGYMPFSHPRTTKRGRTNYCLIRRENTDVPISLILDLEQSVPIHEVRLFPVHLGNNFSIFHRTGLGFPRRFTIDVSDDPEFRKFDRIFSTGDSDYPSPGHRLTIFSGNGASGRYVRMTAIDLPPDPYRGTPVLALAELEVISRGLPVSREKPVAVVPENFRGGSRAHRLVDGLSSHGEIPPMRDWLLQLFERNQLEQQLAYLRERLGVQTLRQTRLVRRLTWTVGLGIPLFAVIVIWQRMVRLRHINRLRENLAADLHDEIGGNFSGIAILCDQLTSSPTMPPQHIRQVDTIATTARESAQNTRNLVTFLESHDLQGELISNMESTASMLLNNIEYTFSKSGEKHIGKLSPKAKWHLLLFFKEALANITKHSEATFVDLKLELTSNRLKLTIEDNGKGIAPKGGRVRRPTHLKIRAQKLGAETQVSSTEKGTTITLTKRI